MEISGENRSHKKKKINFPLNVIADSLSILTINSIEKYIPCCFLRHITVKSVANAEMSTKGTVMAIALIGPAHRECTLRKEKKAKAKLKPKLSYLCPN